MMPCKFCGMLDDHQRVRQGLKQVGKTDYREEGGRRLYRRRYRCLDCGAVLRITGEITPELQEWEQAN